MARVQGVSTRQNDDQAIRLLKAASTAHRTSQMYEGLRVSGSLLFAIAAICVAVLGSTLVVVSLLGFAWSIVSTLVLLPLSRRSVGEARLLQEQFDTYVFQLPWNPASGSKIEPERVHELAAGFKGNEANLHDWYPDFGHFPRPLDVLLCQRATVTWNIRLRQRWGRTVLWLLIAWLSTGLLIGVIADLTVTAILLRWYVPSLGAILLAVEIVRAQHRTATQRQALLARLNADLETRDEQLSTGLLQGLERICRHIQDAIFSSRRDTLRVPNWFYQLFRNKDEAIMRAAAQDL